MSRFSYKRLSVLSYSSPRQSGASLIEILITLALIPIGILALIHLQARAIQYSHSSFQRSIAIVQANDLVERLWAGACVLPDAFNSIRADWENVHAASLPQWNGAQSTVSTTGLTPEYHIEVRWQDERIVNEVTDEQANQYRFQYSTRIPQIDC